MKKAWVVCFSAFALGGCGADEPNFGPEWSPTAEEQVSTQSLERSLIAFSKAGLSGNSFQDLFGSMGLASTGVSTGTHGLTLSGGAKAALVDPSTCSVVSDNRVDYNCTDGDEKITGFVSRTIEGDVTHWQMDLTIALVETGSTDPLTENVHITGDMRTTATSLDGGMHVTVDASSDRGQAHVDGQISYNHIVFDVANQCITSGSVEVQATAAAPGQQSVTRAERITFTGCHVFTIAFSQ